MATLLVSFDIEFDNSDTYNRIYDALNDEIRADLTSDQWWAQTTSFYVVQSEESASVFAARVWNAAKMRKTKDRLLVLDANVKAGAAIGNITDQTLFSLLPFVKKLQ